MSYVLEPTDSICTLPEMSRSVRPLRNCRALWKLWRLMRAERPDIVHTHTAMAGFLGRAAAILSGVPVVAHTFHGNSLRHYFSPFVSAVFLRLERLLARRTDAICVVSEQQREELSRVFRVAPPEKFHVIPLGLDLTPFLSLPPPAPHSFLNVGWLGRLVPVKNVPLLVELIGQTLRQARNINFFIAGDGPEAGAVKALTELFPGRVVWFGWQRDVVPFISRCHVLIQTSLNEGTPVAIIQGMAAARPFVATPVGGLVDMVEGSVLRTRNGCRWYANAILADPDPEAFARALVELAAEDRAAMELRARNFAACRYRREALLDNIDSLYQTLIHQKIGVARRGNSHPATPSASAFRREITRAGN